MTTVGKGQVSQQRTLHEVWVSRRGRINIKKVFLTCIPEAKDILGETIFSHNLMDMVVLAKESGRNTVGGCQLTCYW